MIVLVYGARMAEERSTFSATKTTSEFVCFASDFFFVVSPVGAGTTVRQYVY